MAIAQGPRHREAQVVPDPAYLASKGLMVDLNSPQVFVILKPSNCFNLMKCSFDFKILII
jgi:hypothetical protein